MKKPERNKKHFRLGCLDESLLTKFVSWNFTCMLMYIHVLHVCNLHDFDMNVHVLHYHNIN